MSGRNNFRGKWKIDKHAFLMALHFALKYYDWKSEYDALEDVSRGISYDSQPHGTGISNITANAGMRRAALKGKIDLIEQCAMEAGGEIYKWLLEGVTNDGMDYRTLKAKHKIPCGRDMYYDRRRKFYYLLSRKI